MMDLQAFTVWKGETASLPLGFEQLVEGAWVALDITGSELIFELNWREGSIVKSTAQENGFVIEDGTAGFARIDLTEADINAAPAGNVPFRVRRVTPDEKKVVLVGHFKIKDFP